MVYTPLGTLALSQAVQSGTRQNGALVSVAEYTTCPLNASSANSTLVISVGLAATTFKLIETLPVSVVPPDTPLNVNCGVGGWLSICEGLETFAALPGLGFPITHAPAGSCSSSPLVNPSPSESVAASATVQVLVGLACKKSSFICVSAAYEPAMWQLKQSYLAPFGILPGEGGSADAVWLLNRYDAAIKPASRMIL